MKKYVADLVVTSNERLHPNFCLIKLTQKENFPEMLPGQFVQVKINNSTNTFLRRPISINYLDRKKNELWLLVQIVGEGSKKISETKPGEFLNIIYPLGNYFSEPSTKNSKVLLIGGGVGTAPLLFLGSSLRESGFQPEFLLGARDADSLLQIELFENYGEVHITTEDGSTGEKGYVTNHSILQDSKFELIYTCGPKPMMVAIAEHAKLNNISCEVSLENLMACGIGACLCCVEDTVEGNVCVCTEGPVFNIEKLKWQI